MTSWSFGANSLPEWRSGSLYLMDQPWYLALAEWFLFNVVSWLCCGKWNPVARIPFPHWFPKVRDPKDRGLYTLCEWYGDVGEYLHLCVFDPLFQWLWKHQRRYEICVDLGYDRLREVFGERYQAYFEHEEEL